MIGDPYDPELLASDLSLVYQVYADFFSRLTRADWQRPSKHGEWSLREVTAHLSALTRITQQGIQAALQGKSIRDPDLPDRFEFSHFNRKKIDAGLTMRIEDLYGSFLASLCQSIETASSLKPGEIDAAVEMPIYNRPVTVGELLGIQVVHPGLTHSAQIAEPAGVPPLWTQLPAETRHRVIGRVMRAMSLLYRTDLGGALEAVITFRVAGECGGNWYVDLSPKNPCSGEGQVERSDLSLWFRDTDTFFQMNTHRLNPYKAMLGGKLRMGGNLRLFLRFGSLFNVDARK